MKLEDDVNFKGHFSIEAYKIDGSIEKYEDKNLIMDEARENMAKLIGGVEDSSGAGLQINKFVLGTKGHRLDNILDYKKVGTDGFDSTRTEIFAEEDDAEFYVIPFDVRGDMTVDTISSKAPDSNTCYNSKKPTIMETCSVKRTVHGRTCTYVITVGEAEANSSKANSSVIAYTEASLYAGDSIFSMKTFPARVKEDTVKFIITWSIIF